jgi:hypothetical protein
MILEAVLELNKCSSNVRLMVTSTSKPATLKGLESFDVLDVVLDSKVTTPDISDFVDAEIERREAFSSLSQSTKERMRNILLQKADGM